MKVACIQLSGGENYKKNVKKALYFINKAIRKKTDLIITPETTTLITSNKSILKNNTFRMNEDPFIKKVKILSKKYKKWILIGSLAIKDKKKLRNRSIMIGPNGKIKSCMKTHNILAL